MLLHLICSSLCFSCSFFSCFFSFWSSLRGRKKKRLLLTLQGGGLQGSAFFFWLNVASRPSFPTIKEPTPRNLFCPGLWHRFLFHPQQRTLWGSTIGCHQAGCRSASRLHAGCFLCPGNCWKGWFSAAPLRGGHFTNKPSVISSVPWDRSAARLSDAAWR